MALSLAAVSLETLARLIAPSLAAAAPWSSDEKPLAHHAHQQAVAKGDVAKLGQTVVDSPPPRWKHFTRHVANTAGNNN